MLNTLMLSKVPKMLAFPYKLIEIKSYHEIDKFLHVLLVRPNLAEEYYSKKGQF